MQVDEVDAVEEPERRVSLPEPPDHGWQEPEWMAYALCRAEEAGPDVFFPDLALLRPARPGDPPLGVLLAQAVCRRCVVEPECRAYALDPVNEITDGVWGGIWLLLGEVRAA